MSKKLSEKMVLKKLGIEDFRHLSKDSVMAFASMLPEIDPEVAMKALEQFPDFANTVLGTMKEYKSSIDKAMDEGGKSVKEVYDAYKAVMDALEKFLEDDHLTFEERMQVLTLMGDVADKVSLKDEKHKKFIMQNLMALAGFSIVGIAALAAVLGANTQIGGLSDILDEKI